MRYVIIIFFFRLGVIVGRICPTVYGLLGQVDWVHGSRIEEPVEFGVLGIFPTGTVGATSGSPVREGRSIRIDIEWRRRGIGLSDVVNSGHSGSGSSGHEIEYFGLGERRCTKCMVDVVVIVDKCGV